MSSSFAETRDDRIKHLEFIQAAIARMSSNSFVVKGWSITIVAVLFALAARDSRPSLALIALFPALSFWGLDAYYLRIERLFRKLYDDVRTLSDEELHDKVGPFSLRVAAYGERVDSWLRTAFSGTVFWLHSVVVALVVVLAAILFARTK